LHLGQGIVSVFIVTIMTPQHHILKRYRQPLGRFAAIVA
jgi:hypothetical protein